MWRAGRQFLKDREPYAAVSSREDRIRVSATVTQFNAGACGTYRGGVGGALMDPDFRMKKAIRGNGAGPSGRIRLWGLRWLALAGAG